MTWLPANQPEHEPRDARGRPVYVTFSFGIWERQRWQQWEDRGQSHHGRRRFTSPGMRNRASRTSNLADSPDVPVAVTVQYPSCVVTQKMPDHLAPRPQPEDPLR